MSERGNLMRLHDRLAERDGGWACHYCGQSLAHFGPQDELVGLVESPFGGWTTASGWDFPEADHVVPRAAGGTDALENRVLACPRCNRRKGTRPYDEFVSELLEVAR